MKTVTAALSVCLLLLSLPAAAKRGEEKKKKEPTLLEAYVGLGYYEWNIPFQNSIVASKRYNETFTQSFDPFLVKKFQLAFYNLYGFEGRLNYFTDRLLSGLSSEDPKITRNEKDTFDNIEEAAGLLRYALNKDFKVKTKLVKRNFVGHVKYQADPENTGPVFLYQADGSYRELVNGDTIKWFTNRTDMSLTVEYEVPVFKGYNQGFLAGYHRTAYVAPASFTIRQTDLNMISYGNYFVSEHIIHSIDYGIYSRMEFGPVSFMYSLPLTSGMYQVDNEFFASEIDGFDLGSLLMHGVAELGYKKGGLKITFGAEFQMSSLTLDRGVTLKRGLILYNRGRSVPLARGDKASVRTERSEVVWGPYLHVHYIW